jgi:hypothetical protein|tara:strand:- start:1657 stop:2127 length:471 start_codon:yes stop_codon:yes gene_type:complete
MVSISSVSTLLPPQTPLAPAPTATSVATPTTAIPPTTSSTSSGNGGSSTDSGAGSGGGSTGYTASQTTGGRISTSDATAKSVVNAKTSIATDAMKEDSARRYAINAMRNARVDAMVDSISGSNPPEEADPKLPKAEGPLPLPTADILVNLKNSKKS